MGTDKLFDKYVKTFPRTVAKFIGIGDDEFDVSSLVLKETEKDVDLLFVNQARDRIILLETQGYWDDELYHRMIAAAMLYCIQKKYKGKFETAVLFLNQTHANAARKFDEQFRGEISNLRFTPKVFVLDGIGLEELQKHGDVRLIPLYPLCRVKPEEIEERAPEWANQIRKDPDLAEKERDELLSLLGISISHRLRNLSKEAISKLIGGIAMITDAPILQEILEEKKQEGLQEGGLRVARQMIQNLIVSKFGKLPDDVAHRLQEINNIEKLGRLAVDLLSLDEIDKIRERLR